jgi:hypothetical protein
MSFDERRSAMELIGSILSTTAKKKNSAAESALDSLICSNTADGYVILCSLVRQQRRDLVCTPAL